MAEDAEYIIFDPPRYFSSHQLKLTYKVRINCNVFLIFMIHYLFEKEI